MSETRYLAVAFASRSANGHLRPAVSEAAPEGAKVVRTRADVVAAVYEIDEDTDPRTEAERLRLIIAEETDDDELTAAVSGPKRGSTGAHLALLQAEQAAALERLSPRRGRVLLDACDPFVDERAEREQLLFSRGAHVLSRLRREDLIDQREEAARRRFRLHLRDPFLETRDALFELGLRCHL